VPHEYILKKKDAQIPLMALPEKKMRSNPAHGHFFLKKSIQIPLMDTF